MTNEEISEQAKTLANNKVFQAVMDKIRDEYVAELEVTNIQTPLATNLHAKLSALSDIKHMMTNMPRKGVK